MRSLLGIFKPWRMLQPRSVKKIPVKPPEQQRSDGVRDAACVAWFYVQADRFSGGRVL